jgi:hypothetical protein
MFWESRAPPENVRLVLAVCLIAVFYQLLLGGTQYVFCLHSCFLLTVTTVRPQSRIEISIPTVQNSSLPHSAALLLIHRPRLAQLDINHSTNIHS